MLELNKNKQRLAEYNEDPEKNHTLIESLRRDSSEKWDRIIKELTEFKDSTQVYDIFQTLSDTDNSSNLLNYYWELINSILSNLSSAQLGALGHIFFAWTLYYCVVSIASSFYGDVILVKFKLEERYPRIARWIQYRRKYTY